MKNFNALLIFSTLAFLSTLTACREYQQYPVVLEASTQCTAGVAEIGVGDGFLEFLCGCTSAPAAGTILSAPANVVCHVPSGTFVLFEYIDIHTTHQIVNSSGLAFTSGQPILPGNGVYTTAAQFVTVGTYGFEDAFNLALQGQIIVP
jgi:hypothetical protein